MREHTIIINLINFSVFDLNFYPTIVLIRKRASNRVHFRTGRRLHVIRTRRGKEALMLIRENS